MIRALARCAVLLACVLVSALPSRADDLGGNVFWTATQIDWYDAHDREKRIEGRCYSACTMWLGYRGACFDRGVVLGFHSARLGPFGRSGALNHILEDYYGPRTKAWFRRYADDTLRIQRLPIATVVGWGEARLCAD